MKASRYFIVFFILILFFSCSSNNPRDVARAFLSSLVALDFEKASLFVTEDSRGDFDMYVAFLSLIPEEKRGQLAVRAFGIIDVAVEGDKARVLYKIEDEAVDELFLVRENGSWKVDWFMEF
ncbi:hypothetical protein WKV44_01950 [Spirochaetia bacterium 38H-sp]|uniref:DUF4878 domain-containing protein n=1 Tax=Rarispira pelagica TaxID=3141764 RepID=A0ABU9U9F5_9SPIR